MNRAVASVLLIVLACLVSSCDAPQNQAEFPTNTKIIFLHHSTGQCVWDGGVSAWFGEYNAAHGTSYGITELAYPSAPYPWQNYPYDYWYLWVSAPGDVGHGQASLETLTAQYNVIVFKHCFPVSSIGPDTGTPDIASSSQTVENYKLQYDALKAKMHSFPNNRFIVWTGAALTADSTDPDSAARARDFFDWVKNTWDEVGDNIFVFDFRQLETEGGLYLLAGYAAGATDSHPNAAFSTTVAPLFSSRVVSVILGTADSTSLTGE